MEELLQHTLDGAMDGAMMGSLEGVPLTGNRSADAMVFLLIAALGLVMALVYVPIRLFLTLTARSRRLKLLQRIRSLREELGSPLEASK